MILKITAGEIFFKKSKNSFFSHETNLTLRSPGKDIFISTEDPCGFEILIRNPKLPHIGSCFFNVQEQYACELFQKIAAKDTILSPKSNISLLRLPSVTFSMATIMMKQ